MPTATRPDVDAGPGVRLVDGQPGELGAGEVRVEPEARTCSHQVLVPRLAQLVAQRRRPPVLPDDRVAWRAERLAVPEHCGLALVGDADSGGYVGRAVQRSPARREDRLPDVLGGVLDPAVARKVLGELAIAAPDDRAGLRRRSAP